MTANSIYGIFRFLPVPFILEVPRLVFSCPNQLHAFLECCKAVSQETAVTFPSALDLITLVTETMFLDSGNNFSTKMLVLTLPPFSLQGIRAWWLVHCMKKVSHSLNIHYAPKLKNVLKSSSYNSCSTVYMYDIYSGRHSSILFH